ncbi:hypothetical protein FRC09_016858, partial [Ceratobasidium sp. 395]
MPPKSKRTTGSGETITPAAKKRRGAASALPNPTQSTPRNNSASQTAGAGPSNYRQTKPLPRKVSSANPWAQLPDNSPKRDPPSASSTRPPNSTVTVEIPARRSKRGRPEEPSGATEAPSPPKRARTSNAPLLDETAQQPGQSERSDSESVAGDDVVITGESAAPEHEKMTPEEIEEMCTEWEGSLQLLRKRVLAVSVQDEKIAQDLSKAIIGSAYFRFPGRGSVKPTRIRMSSQ